ncbi:MAG: hypothetical protein JSR39_01120 [Verrucomicrobia bacterium]|nr:hypothetical protein [Verrucomicrobiota bacterium]
MKTSHYHFLTLLFILCFGSIAANAGCPKCPKPPKFIECEKIYIQSSQIDIVEDQIYIHFSGNTVQTSGIHTDHGGMFIKDYRQGDCPDGSWECRVCHACNENYYIWCRTCYN